MTSLAVPSDAACEAWVSNQFQISLKSVSNPVSNPVSNSGSMGFAIRLRDFKRLNIWYLRLRYSKSRDRVANPIEPEFETGFETGFEIDLRLI